MTLQGRMPQNPAASEMRKMVGKLVVTIVLAALSAIGAAASPLTDGYDCAEIGQDSTSSAVKMQKSDKDYWKKALRRYDFSIINDPDVRFPKFLQTCVNVYRWGDKTFNSYDTAYVVPTGKNWKLMAKANTWLVSYAGHLDKTLPLLINSKLTNNFGFQISFMAVSMAYMVDMDNLFAGDPIRNTKLDFSFSSSRLGLDAYYLDNRGNTYIHRFGDYGRGKRVNETFKGLHRKSYGFQAYYVFNHNHYAQVAAYGFSKYQKRSSGSFLMGISSSHQDISLDFKTLPDNLRECLPDSNMLYRFRYNDHCLIIGYAYNWVFKKNWLFNVTLTPSVGIKHSTANSIDGSKNLLSLNYRSKMGVVHNHGDVFYGMNLLVDGHWYRSHRHSFFNSLEDLTLLAGFRF